MVDPASNSLLVLYDDAQDIYGRSKKQKFSFKSLGIQAQGRTTILKINYRNTREILQLATRFAADLLRPTQADEDGVPVLAPISGGRHGEAPQIVNLPDIQAQARYIAERFQAAHRQGTAWKDMALIYRDYPRVGKAVLHYLRQHQIPCTYFKQMTFGAQEDTVKVLTMHSCKGLEFPLVAIPGLNLLGETPEHQEEDARLLYVAMTRATRELLLTTETLATATV